MHNARELGWTRQEPSTPQRAVPQHFALISFPALYWIRTPFQMVFAFAQTFNKNCRAVRKSFVDFLSGDGPVTCDDSAPLSATKCVLHASLPLRAKAESTAWSNLTHPLSRLQVGRETYLTSEEVHQNTAGLEPRIFSAWESASPPTGRRLRVVLASPSLAGPLGARGRPDPGPLSRLHVRRGAEPYPETLACNRSAG